MQIRISNNDDLSELYRELDRIKSDDTNEVKCPPFRNEFFGVEDIQNYLQERKRYREYIEAHQS